MASEHEKLRQLLIQTAQAHHKEFEEMDGYHPNWAFWYADYMQAEFQDILDREVSVEGIADLLRRYDDLQAQEAPDEKWPDYYARKLLTFYLE